MKKDTRFFSLILLIFSLVFGTVSCQGGGQSSSEVDDRVQFREDDPFIIGLNETRQLEYEIHDISGTPAFTSDDESIVSVDSAGNVTGNRYGATDIYIEVAGVTDSIRVYVYDDDGPEISFMVALVDEETIHVGQKIPVEASIWDVDSKYMQGACTIEMVTSDKIAEYKDGVLTAKSVGEVVLYARLLDRVSIPTVIHVLKRRQEEAPFPDDSYLYLVPSKLFVDPLETFSFKCIMSSEKYDKYLDRVQIYAFDGAEGLRSTAENRYYFSGVSGKTTGKASFVAIYTDDRGMIHLSGVETVTWGDDLEAPESFTITPRETEISLETSIDIYLDVNPSTASHQVNLFCLNDPDAFSFSADVATGLKTGTFQIQGEIQDVMSNVIEITVVDD